MSAVNLNLSLDKIFDHLKKASPIVIAGGIVTGLVSFLPIEKLAFLHLNHLSENTLTIIGFVFLCCAFLTIIVIIQSIVIPIMNKIKSKKNAKALKKSFRQLNVQQKKIIVDILQSESKTITLALDNGNTRYLVDRKFIYSPTQVMSVGYSNSVPLKYVVQPWLMDAYNSDPDYFTKQLR